MLIQTIPCLIDDISRINVFIIDEQNEYKLISKEPFIPDNKKPKYLLFLNNKIIIVIKEQ